MNIKCALSMGFIGLTVLAGLFTSTGAVAAEGDDLQTAADKGWIHNASPYPYDPAARPSSTADRKSTGFSALYFLPDGRGPETGQTDLTLSYLAPIKLFGESDVEEDIETIDFDFTSFDQMEAHLGTRFIDAQALATNSSHDPTPDVALYGSTLTVVRPACESPLDPRNYDFQVALLGDNGYQYSAEVDVTFGKWPLKGCRATANANTSEPTKAPVTATPRPATSPEAAPEKTVEERPRATEEAAVPASQEDAFNFTQLLIVLGVLAAGIIALLVLKTRARKKPSYSADGHYVGDEAESVEAADDLDSLFESPTGEEK